MQREKPVNPIIGYLVEKNHKNGKPQHGEEKVDFPMNDWLNSPKP
jgi:hypothetical protein